MTDPHDICQDDPDQWINDLELEPGYKLLWITKANPRPNQKIPDLIIKITGAIDEKMTPEKMAECYDKDSDNLCEMLCKTLPGGTIDRLAAKLLLHEADLFRLPS